MPDRPRALADLRHSSNAYLTVTATMTHITATVGQNTGLRGVPSATRTSPRTTATLVQSDMAASRIAPASRTRGRSRPGLRSIPR